MSPYGVAIIGCGLIGNKRAKVLGPAKLVAAVDPISARAEQLAAAHVGCIAAADWEAFVNRPDVHIVIVATTNDQLAPITLAAIQNGKHVLVEKPAARSAAELRPVVEAAAASSVVVRVGFNHRFHPALLKSREIVDSGALGPLMFVRGRYGHGGRLGMEKEWRGNPALSGGGEMLDQGVHLIDLARWFLGEFTDVSGHVATFFWNWPVEDNGFALLKTASGKVAWLHASCSEWKNLFSLEIYGRDGKLAIDGLGGSYGVERLAYYKMLPRMGPPETTLWEYPGEDQSWRLEWEEFAGAIEGSSGRTGGTLDDAIATLHAVDRLYAQQSMALR